MNTDSIFTTDLFLLDNPNDLISIDKWQKTVNLLAELFEAPAGFLVQYTKEGFQVTISSEQETNPYPSGIVIDPQANIFCRKIVETGEALYVNNAMLDPCWDTNPEVHNDGFRSYLGVPVFWPCGSAFGTFCVMDYQETDYKKSYIELITQLKELLESDLALIGSYAQMQQLAITDPLCNVNNRRGFNILAEQRIKLAKRTGGLLCLLYLDIDQFKCVNDKFGHGVGDAVLQSVAQVLSDTVREADVVGRLGGDEFVALIALDNMSGLANIKQRLTDAFEKVQNASSIPKVTVSIGSTFITESEDISDLLDAADRDMLDKKRGLAR
ncbi:diguanylate cyclase [Shewanella sairae]|uniref:diguanylate cyclase n=1 Tax=Shewanella sairae TaxID=190310 RepID=A0ABQ4PAJ8_9GAMM|nr:sensor domain-containing diguanylate cyclase [Shewanella sairae]MCL1130817.1 sensor domain-containing diguanylate cyclase [Shewanella sairae]GIU44558.1 diguanylate cyclase [Shewanella sairae]